MSNELVQGEIAVCGSCDRARPIQSEIVDLFNYRVGFGPADETDMFLERDGEIQCYWCADNELVEEINP